MTARRWYLWFQDDDGRTVALHGPYVSREDAERALAVLYDAEERAMLGFDLDAPVDELQMAAFWYKVQAIDFNVDELAALR